MRGRMLVLSVAAGLVSAATIVALASASQSVSRGVRVTPEAANAWLPVGVAPAGTDWWTAGGDSANTAYSTLTQINTTNVSKLKVVWQASYNDSAHATPTTRTENQPIVVSGADKNLPLSTGTMYLTFNDGVVAINPETGATLWRYQGPAYNTAAPPGTQVHTARDESFGKGMVFAGQQDGSVVALNAKTGTPVWTAQVSAVGTFGRGNVYGESAPFTSFYDDGKDGLVFSAPNGSDSPMRGHEDAYNAKTGNLVWRAFTTPDPQQFPFILSWSNPAEAATGGAASWSLPAVDPQLGLLYFGTGNIYPETGRAPGKGLWTDSLMAVSLKTGALKWFFQTVHHDEWDYDLANPPVRSNPLIDGKRVPVISVGGKTGYMYVLNAVNGGPVPHFPIPEVPVPNLNGGKGAALNNNWPTQPEPQGGAGQIMPLCMTAELAVKQFGAAFPTAPNGLQMIPTCPFASPYSDAYYLWGPAQRGGINWIRGSYDPQTNDRYVSAMITALATKNVSPTDWHQQLISTDQGTGGTLTALNLGTNKIDWQITRYQPVPGQFTTNATSFAGIVSTAGGLVFAIWTAQGYFDPPTPVAGEFTAYNAKTGKPLWSWLNNKGHSINAPPITYSVKGKQYVAVVVAGPDINAASATYSVTVFSL
jgi:quinohemoprotein ethanol dehydrogenase